MESDVNSDVEREIRAIELEKENGGPTWWT